MCDITVLKDKHLYMNGLTRILEEEMSDHTIRTVKESLFYNENQPPTPDLLVVDMDTDVNLLEHFKSKRVKIVAWTSDTDKENIIEFLKLDLHGYFFLEIEISDMIDAMESIIAGKKYIHPYFSEILFEDYIRISQPNVERPIGLLSKREWDVLEKMVRGYQNEAIATVLDISVKTVKNHISSILRKLHVKDRTNAVLTAVRNNWVDVYS